MLHYRQCLQRFSLLFCDIKSWQNKKHFIQFVVHWFDFLSIYRLLIFVKETSLHHNECFIVFIRTGFQIAVAAVTRVEQTLMRFLRFNSHLSLPS